MRIAVAGTHCSGKTTLIDDFVQVHSEFRAEPEPYDVLAEMMEGEFASMPSAEDFVRQLQVGLQQWSALRRRDNVICERSPYDFLAYLDALAELGRDDRGAFEEALEWVRDTGPLFELIVYLPAGPNGPISPPADEDPELRAAMDESLRRILIDDAFDLFAAGPPVCEAVGAPSERLRSVDTFLR